MASWDDLLADGVKGYPVYATIKPLSAATWREDLADIARRTSKSVEEIIDLNPDLFTTSKIFPQDAHHYTPILIQPAQSFPDPGPDPGPQPEPGEGGVFSLANNTCPLPAGSYSISQQYGHNGHGGTDLAAAGGTPIYAVQDGVVRTVQAWDGVTKTGNQSWGNMIVLQHVGPDSSVFYSLYAHMQSPPSIAIGTSVAKGSVIGAVGNTGNVYGAHGGYHLHIEVWAGGYGTAYRVNPANYVPF